MPIETNSEWINTSESGYNTIDFNKLKILWGEISVCRKHLCFPWTCLI